MQPTMASMHHFPPAHFPHPRILMWVSFAGKTMEHPITHIFCALQLENKVVVPAKSV
jgi:hypothetical protein